MRLQSIILLTLLTFHGALCADMTASSGPQNIETVDYVIIGAGTAGIFAANTLAAQGKGSVILEARNRIGGRIDTRFVDGYPYPIEMGASFVHDASISIWPSVAAEGNFTLTEWNDYDILFVQNNKRLSDSTAFEILTNFTEIWDAHFNYSQLGRSDQEALFLSGYTTPNPYIEAVLGAFITEPAIDMNQHDSTGWNPSPEEELGLKYIIPGGYKQMLDYVFNNYSLATQGLRLNSEVRGIDYSNRDGSTIISYYDLVAKKTKYIKATKGVIITLPMGVLKAGAVSFNPCLPIPMQYSINKVSFGDAKKITLIFDWKVGPRLARDDYNWYWRVPGTSSDKTVIIWNYMHVYGQPVLQSFVAGSFASYLETLSDSQVVSMTMKAIRQFLPNLPDPIKTIVSHWGTDKYARGVYTDFSVGTTTEDFENLMVPFGPKKNLILAGEHVGVWTVSPKFDMGTTNQASYAATLAAEYLLSLNSP